jgi:hypothetical protein
MGSSQHHGCFFSHGVAALGYCYEPVAQHSLPFPRRQWFSALVCFALHRLERIAPQSTAGKSDAPDRKQTPATSFSSKNKPQAYEHRYDRKISCVRASGCLCYHANLLVLSWVYGLAWVRSRTGYPEMNGCGSLVFTVFAVIRAIILALVVVVQRVDVTADVARQ